MHFAGQVVVGIETDRGPWVQALVAAGFAGSMRSIRCRSPGFRQRYVPCRGPRATPPTRTPSPIWCVCQHHQLRPVAGDTAEG